MRIISKEHDYYDSSASFGIDPSCIYNRKSEAHELKDHDQYRKYMIRSDRPDLFAASTTKHEFKKILIGFCGEIYPLVMVQQASDGVTFENGRFTDPKKYDPLFFYDDSIIDYRGNLYKTDQTNRMYRYWDKKEYDNFFDKNIWNQYKNYFVEYKAPVFMVEYQRDGHKTVLTTNVILKDLEFYRIKDAPTAFQEVFMFISGVLGVNENPIVEISDKVKAQQKGHDGKYSFRQPPSNKPKRPKKWR